MDCKYLVIVELDVPPVYLLLLVLRLFYLEHVPENTKTAIRQRECNR